MNENFTEPTDACLNLIKGFEHCYLKGYHGTADRAGVITIGWGTVQYPSGEKPHLGDVITQEQADSLLVWEVKQKIEGVIELLGDTKVTQQQFDALVSFAYEEGLGALGSSTLLKKLKVNPDDTSIYVYTVNPETGWGYPKSCEFLKWVYSDGKIVNGIIRRRTSEAYMYKTGKLNFFED